MTLKGSNGPSAAIGAKVVVTAGGKRQVLVNQWATSYLSNNDPRLHAGMGKQKNADSIEIAWPDGRKEVYSDIACNRYITIFQGKGIIDDKH